MLTQPQPQLPAGRISAYHIAALPEREREEFYNSLSQEEQQVLQYRWSFWARPNQLPPRWSQAGTGVPWRTWLLLAGRGFGKTRTGAEWLRWKVEKRGCKRVALVARTAADARDVMVEGESGLLACSPPWFKPDYQPSKRRLVWPNGAIGTIYTGDKPSVLRGPQHDAAWADELAAWRYPETWDMLMLGLRLGKEPQVCVTTTPRPTKVIKNLYKLPSTAISRGTTYDNRGNLAPAFFDEIIRQYEGTRLGLQELLARILDDNPNALWKRSTIEENRFKRNFLPHLDRCVIAIDPSVKEHRSGKQPELEEGSECGIVVVGLGRRPDGRPHGYVLEDLSAKLSPRDWAIKAVSAYKRWNADGIVAEINNGGALVEAVIKAVDENVPFASLYASRGKRTRAEPVAALYERGLVHHLGSFMELEDQMCEWIPGEEESPDRMDALVWGVTYLMLDAIGGVVNASNWA